jgi:hypothetical protein
MFRLKNLLLELKLAMLLPVLYANNQACDGIASPALPYRKVRSSLKKKNLFSYRLPNRLRI